MDVLVVDDDQDIRELLVDLLLELELTVASVPDGDAAIRALQSAPNRYWACRDRRPDARR